MNLELPVVDDKAVWNAWLVMLNVPAISAAMELGIFESLHDEPASAEELAARLAFEERPLRALLPFLSHLGYLNDYNGGWQLTAMARHFMLADSPFCWSGIFKREARMQARSKLLVEAITGKKEEHIGQDRPGEKWESGQVDMEMAREVTAFMHSHSMAAAIGMTRSVDFSDVSRVLDVGGGSGCFVISLAKSRQDLTGTVMELPAICELAEQYIADAGVSEQIDTISIDMFREAWPEGYDTHFFSNIFHDWSVDTCRQIAKSSFDALPSGGKILLHEMLLNDCGKAPQQAVAFSLLMAIGTKGQQFTLPMLVDILESAGFVNVSSTHSYGYYSIVRAEKP